MFMTEIARKMVGRVINSHSFTFAARAHLHTQKEALPATGKGLFKGAQQLP